MAQVWTHEQSMRHSAIKAAQCKQEALQAQVWTHGQSMGQPVICLISHLGSPVCTFPVNLGCASKGFKSSVHQVPAGPRQR